MGIDQDECVSRGCCWLPVHRGSLPKVEQPWCFYANTGRSEYSLHNATGTSAPAAEISVEPVKGCHSLRSGTCSRIHGAWLSRHFCT